MAAQCYDNLQFCLWSDILPACMPECWQNLLQEISPEGRPIDYYRKYPLHPSDAYFRSKTAIDKALSIDTNEQFTQQFNQAEAIEDMAEFRRIAAESVKADMDECLVIKITYHKHLFLQPLRSADQDHGENYQIVVYCLMQIIHYYLEKIGLYKLITAGKTNATQIDLNANKLTLDKLAAINLCNNILGIKYSWQPTKLSARKMGLFRQKLLSIRRKVENAFQHLQLEYVDFNIIDDVIFWLNSIYMDWTGVIFLPDAHTNKRNNKIIKVHYQSRIINDLIPYYADLLHLEQLSNIEDL